MIYFVYDKTIIIKKSIQSSWLLKYRAMSHACGPVNCGIRSVGGP